MSFTHLTVVIDAQNVAYQAARILSAEEASTAPGRPCVAAVRSVIDFWRARAVDTVAFIPEWWLRSKQGPAALDADDSAAVRALLAAGAAITVPSKDADDPYILEYAWERRAFVVSNDMFRDHAERWRAAAAAAASSEAVVTSSVAAAAMLDDGDDDGFDVDDVRSPASGAGTASQSLGGGIALTAATWQAKLEWLRSHVVSFALRPLGIAPSAAQPAAPLASTGSASGAPSPWASPPPASWEFMPNPAVMPTIAAALAAASAAAAAASAAAAAAPAFPSLSFASPVSGPYYASPHAGAIISTGSAAAMSHAPLAPLPAASPTAGLAGSFPAAFHAAHACVGPQAAVVAPTFASFPAAAGAAGGVPSHFGAASSTGQWAASSSCTGAGAGTGATSFSAAPVPAPAAGRFFDSAPHSGWPAGPIAALSAPTKQFGVARSDADAAAAAAASSTGRGDSDGLAGVSAALAGAEAVLRQRAAAEAAAARGPIVRSGFGMKTADAFAAALAAEPDEEELRRRRQERSHRMQGLGDH